MLTADMQLAAEAKLLTADMQLATEAKLGS